MGDRSYIPLLIILVSPLRKMAKSLVLFSHKQDDVVLALVSLLIDLEIILLCNFVTIVNSFKFKQTAFCYKEFRFFSHGKVLSLL